MNPGHRDLSEKIELLPYLWKKYISKNSWVCFLVQYWGKVVGPEFEIIVAQMAKFKEGGGLGISLEGTVEKVDGAEQNPHHYIRLVIKSEVLEYVLTVLVCG
jgi:hypothetical protein